MRAGVLYFAVAFGAGVGLGTARVLWAVPRLGERLAELAELPLMLVVSVLAARWAVRRLAAPRARARRLAVGLVALGLLLLAELTLVLLVRGLALEAYIASRDPVSGGAYVVLLGLFAVLPLLVRR